MFTVTTSVEINRPIDEVFGYMSNLDNLEWTVGLVEVNHDGSLRLGAGGTDVRLMGRREVTMPWTVTAYEPPHRVQFEYQKPFPLTADFRLESVKGRTLVACETTMKPKGLWRLLGPLMALETKKTDRTQFAKLREILECEAP